MITKNYSDEINKGTMFRNSKTGQVWISLEMGSLGSFNYGLMKNDKGAHNLVVSRVKDDKKVLVKVGESFKATRKDGTVVEGIEKISFGLDNTYNSELKKNVISNQNCLYVTTHLLKEEVTLSNNVIKIGYLKGTYGVTSTVSAGISPSENSTTYEVENEDDEIPF